MRDNKKMKRENETTEGAERYSVSSRRIFSEVERINGNTNNFWRHRGDGTKHFVTL